MLTKRSAFLCAVLLLSACTAPPVDDSVRVFSGTVENYGQGPGILIAITSLAEDAASFGSGTIDAEGNFNFALPRGEELDPEVLQPFTFCEGITITDPAALGTGMLFLMVTSADGFVGLLFQATTEEVFSSFNPPDGSILATRVYADRDVSITGTCRDFPNTFEVHLRRGWNIVQTTYRQPFAFELRTGVLPQTVRWFFIDWPAIP